MENTAIWEKHRKIPTDQAKPITGKDYGGTSPKPHYIIWCLTDMFGPIGKGFGWNVLAEDFTLLGDTHLHWCRIRFWWRDAEGVHECEQYGQTKAAYVTSGGKHRVDEDAPKKSLTDAVVKAASQLGVAADIFLGRWDDSKYLADLRAEERALKEPPPEAAPPRDPVAIADGIISAFGKATTAKMLNACVSDGTKAAAAWDWLEVEAKEHAARVKAAFESRLKELNEKENAQ
jgi:hypothetical protein